MISENNPNNLNVGMRCIKYMIFTVNFMFVLTGVVLIVVALSISSVYDDFSHFLDDKIMSPPFFLGSIGVITLIVAFFGCLGAIKESTLWINIYGVLLAGIFFLQVIAAIMAYVMQGQVETMLIRTMNESIYDYPSDTAAKDAVDFMQNVLECCGVNGPDDWEGVLQSTNPGDDVIVPESCCSHLENGECVIVKGVGCLPRLNYFISQGTWLIGTGATAVALVQILGVLCAFMLAKSIRQAKSIRAARKWQVQQDLLAKPYPSYEQMVKEDKLEFDKLTAEKTYTPESPSVC